MRRKGNWYLVVLLVLVPGSMARPANGPSIDQAWLERTRTEGQATYAKYLALSDHLEQVWEIRADKAATAGPGKGTFRPHVRRVRVCRLGGNVLEERIQFDAAAPKVPQISLRCDNQDYHFSLRQAREGGLYALRDYALGKRKHPLTEYAHSIHGISQSYLHDVLLAIEKKNQYTLRALTFDKATGLLRAEVAGMAGNTPAQSRISLEPNHGWRVVERWVETPYLVARDRMTYGVTVSGVEFPTESKNLSTYKVAQAPPNLAITTRLISLKETDKTPADFRLSGFGLPEPVDAPPLEKPTRWYLWILLAAAACGVLACGFAYVRHRRQKRTIPNPVAEGP